ncbi:UDP-Glycosyltransferase/glycogen phosphorylase [Bimuria novae-zelandiae CBS 107.79]|uniref:UDP-Glycosyltransferase/glycogen phosphorylase n=1 Tax=Bimuria novae-zelandiae CBS 107.79 TaxID=1447943 RepID=A0A6A5V5D6_9PLEO|nr:UDP-Glycosyltransferase/glycogen phosphorylase [Bimuria novae-zelandiae CBS 107.79]
MAGGSQQPPPLPTAIHLHEPEFPSPQEQNVPQQRTLSVPSATDFAATDAGLPGALSTNRHVTPPAASKKIIEERSPRPSMQKSSTDRPQPTARRSIREMKRAGTAQDMSQHMHRPTALKFDPYSSGSDSSSDEDEAHGTQLDGTLKHGGKTSRSNPFSKLKLRHEGFETKGKVSKRDGRVKLSISETLNSGYFAKTLGAGLKKHFAGAEDLQSTKSGSEKHDVAKIAPEDDPMEDPKRRVRLNVVIIVIGSRGDIQPFLRIGKILKEDYGHRVRIATHSAFKQFIQDDSGLEFFSIGGDPSELMAFMVKNPGLIPNLETVREGEIGRRRAAMYEMFQGMWRACISATDDENDNANLKMMGDRTPFICDAIIANPPSFAPPHIAERLGVPLHMMFTFPYTPTTQFPHPLANIQNSNVDMKYTNFMSYPLVEMMTWQGLGDLVNRFRSKTLHLDEVSTLWAPGQLYRLKVPYTYMWSPGLVPKPKDWGPEIDIAGFVFLDLASSFKPPDDLKKFLDAGEPPVYIGFGSIVVDDPDEFTKLIFKAIEIAGVRALVSKGWGGFGSNATAPDNVFMLENTPHDWLFPKVSAVVHHGGAGTTAIGLKCAKPTMVVPFFGDQPFWGAMVSKAKAGAHDCILYKHLTAERLAEGIKQCLTEEAKRNVQKIADSIAKEGDGALNAVRSFHRSLPLREVGSMRCSLLPNHAAAWRLENTSIRLSALAAELLVEWKKIKWNELRLLRQYEWNDFGGPGEPLTGVWGAIVDTVGDLASGVGSVPVNMARSVKKREKYYEKKYKIAKKQKHKQQKKDTLDRANANFAKESANGHTTNGNANGSTRPPALHRESTLSELIEPEDILALEFAREAEQGLRKTAGAIIRFPMRVHLALAQGFHNAPRLYGDATVRRIPRITGVHSGLRAGRNEFVYGIRDGISGLWMQPIRGAQEAGVMGCVRGLGIGIGGFLLKDISAIVGPSAFLMKGCDEEYMKKYQPTHFIRRARILQGRNEAGELVSAADRPVNSEAVEDCGRKQKEVRVEVERQVSTMWKSLQPQIKEERKLMRSGITAALLGQLKLKEGAPVPMKDTRPSADTQRSEKKARTMPVQQMASDSLTNGEGKAESGGGLRKADSAPAPAQQYKEKPPRRRWCFDEPLEHEKMEAKQ